MQERVNAIGHSFTIICITVQYSPNAVVVFTQSIAAQRILPRFKFFGNKNKPWVKKHYVNPKQLVFQTQMLYFPLAPFSIMRPASGGAGIYFFPSDKKCGLSAKYCDSRAK